MQNEDWVTGNIGLNIGGKPLNMQVTVPGKPVKPHRMLPIFHQMTNAFVDVSVQAVESKGKKISCKAGCGACCRQPVPISEIEAYQLAELVETMDEPRKSEIKRRFGDAFAQLQSMNWFEKMQNCSELAKTETPENVMKEGFKMAMEYFHQAIACPFLENESCSIHQSRPVACREYLVTSPAENCSAPTAETVDVIDLLIKPSENLKFVGRTQNLAKIGFIPLISSLEIVKQFPENFIEKKGERWLADFFQMLTQREIPKKGVKSKPKAKKRPKKRRL